MKQYFLALALILISSIAHAQTQQGIVKTRGRIVNGQLKPGTKLPGATITLNIGNPQVSGQNGAFSFNVPSGKNYSLVTVKKQGYTLADPDYTRRSFMYSASNPFYVVLEDENQRQADINAATRKVRKTLNAQLEKREEEIEALKAQNKLTEKEYQERLQELYDNQSKSEQLVKEMAECYVSTDYDQLDEFNRQVQMYIEEGELQKADSMIRSKGDLEQRTEEYRKIVAANIETEQLLEKSKAGAAKTYEDLSQDYYNAYSIAKLQYRWDDALRYLKERADLDTTVVNAVLEYAKLADIQYKLDDAAAYYKRCLSLFAEKADTINIMNVYTNLGFALHLASNYQESEECYKKAYTFAEYLFSKEPDVYRKELSRVQNNLGILYRDLKKREECERYLLAALQNREILVLRDSTLENLYNLGMTANNLGNFYRDIDELKKSEKYFLISLENREKTFVLDPNTYRPSLAVTLLNAAGVYSDMDEREKELQCNQQALAHYSVLYEQNPDAHRINYVMLLNNLGNFYYGEQEFDKCIEYHQQAQSLIESSSATNAETFQIYLADAYSGMGNAYHYKDDYERGRTNLLKAIDLCESLYQKHPDVYRHDLEQFYVNIALLYDDFEKSEEALAAADKALAFNSCSYGHYDLRGMILLSMRRNQEALEMYYKVLELNPDFLKDHPDGTNLSNGLKKLGMIE